MGAQTRRLDSGLDFLRSGGQMGVRIADFPWDEHPLGPVLAWPQSLKTSVSLILNSQHPMWIGWGPSMWFLYNDAYVHVLSLAKHPWALGRPASEVWAEIWDVCGPLADKVFRKGEASFVDDVRLFMRRGDFVEETFYSFSYSPIRDESGGVGGLFCPSNDVTAKVVGARRLRTLSELSANALAEKTTAAACATAAVTLEKNPDDVPFALLYLAEGGGCILEQQVGSSSESFSPQRIELSDRSGSHWPLFEVLESGRTRRLSFGHFASLPVGPAERSITEYLVLPVAPRADMRPLGVLVVGINPTIRLDSEYQAFFDLVASNIGTAIQSARASEQERRRMEALAELDRAKTVFFSNISHEFRTPLTLLMGPIGELIGKPAHTGTEKATELLQLAYRNGLRMQKLVNTLLEFSRIAAGRMQASYIPTDLATMTADLASNFRSACESAGLRLVVDCPPLGEPVYVDRGMWEKIVLNLLSNAFKFTFVGEIDVRLTIEGDNVEFSVQDTGVGIPEHELPRLFERFHRVEAQKSRTHEGSGIGLALVNELVHIHGGSVSVRSEVAKGTTVRVKIPRGSAHLDPALIVAEATDSTKRNTVDQFMAEVEATMGSSAKRDIAAVTAPSAAGGRVLVADDNRDLREYIIRILSPTHSVVAVPDGLKALKALRQAHFDLVITDVMMPEMDGFALLKAIRSDEALRATPVMMLSARAGEESAVEGLGRGADDYLAKPFTSEELLARVSAHVRTAREREAKAVAQQQSLERTKRIVEALQADFLPSRLPHTPRLRIDAVYQAAEADALVGGDWIDAVHLPDGRYLLSVGDVTGSGLDASAIAGRLRHAIVDFALANDNVAGVLQNVNRVLLLEHPGVYATALVAFIDEECTALTYASAGHPPPLLAKSGDDEAMELPKGGLALGIEERVELESQSVPIPPGAVVALYTDGMVEFSRSPALAEHKLRSALARLVGDTTTERPAPVVRDTVLGGAATTDDAALLVVQFASAVPRASNDPDAVVRKWHCNSRDAYAARSCRREAMEFLRRLSDGRSLFEAELVIGEILANTVEHAPGDIELLLDFSGEKPVIRVRDSGPGIDHLRTSLPRDALSEDGRGLFLIKTLAEDVTISQIEGSGTEVRAVLPLRRAVVLA